MTVVAADGAVQILVAVAVVVDEDRAEEIAFPLFGPSGERASNPVSEACERPRGEGRLYAEDAALERYILDNTDRLLTAAVRPNPAVFFSSDDPAAWHFACPVREGWRSCLVFVCEEA